MLLTVLMLVGFVGAMLAILLCTPALERWATAAPALPEGEAPVDVTDEAVLP